MLPSSTQSIRESSSVDPDSPRRLLGSAASPRREGRFSRVTDAIRGRDRRADVALLGIVLLAAVVRLVGSRFGFPLLLHPDEWAIVDGVVDMAQRNSFEPHFYLRPDHVEMKLNYLVFVAFAQLFTGQSVEASVAADPVPFYWMARLLTVAFGIATVVLAYAVAARWSRVAGLIAALVFALFPPFVTHSHFATPDVPLTFALLLMTYALMRYVAAPGLAPLLWACFAVALAVAIKYPGAVGTLTIGAVVIAAAIRDRAWARIVSHGLLAIAATLLFLFVISPSLFTDLSGVRAELAIQSAGDRLGHPDYGLLGNMAYYGRTFVQFSGLALLALAVVGLVAVVRRRYLEALPWVIGVVVWVSLSTLPLTWERWGLPMWITPLILASVGLAVLFEKARGPRTRWVPVAVGALVAVHLSAAAAASSLGLSAPDTRQAALAFTDANDITESESVYEGYSPFLPGAPWLFFDQVAREGRDYRFTTSDGARASYVVISSGMYNRVMSDPNYVDERPIYAWIDEHLEEVASFVPAESPRPSYLEPVSIVRNLRFAVTAASGGMSGPTIRIFRVPDAPKR